MFLEVQRPPRRIRPVRPKTMSEAAGGALEIITAAGREVYDRARHLPRLIPVWPAEIADQRPEARRMILSKLARALRAERNRGRAGHWTYDINRHIGLKQAYAAERQLLKQAERAGASELGRRTAREGQTRRSV